MNRLLVMLCLVYPMFGQAGKATMFKPYDVPLAEGEFSASQYPGADIGAKINAAFAACPADAHGYKQCRIRLPLADHATWSTPVTITSPGVSLIGLGSSATVFNCTVNGDCLRIYMFPFTISQAGTFSGFSLLGNGSPNGVGIHMGEVIAARLEDLALGGFTGTHGVALWLDNAHKGTWTERNIISGVHLDNSKKLLRFTQEAGPDWNSFGYNRFLDVRLNPNTQQIGVSIENLSNVYNGTFRFTVNKGGTDAIVFHLQDSAKWDQIELHASGEEMGRGGLLWDIPAGTSVRYYGEVLLSTVNPTIASRISGDFQSIAQFTKLNIALSTPNSSSASCSRGDYAQDANYVYVCTSEKHWRRAALSNF